jgi:DNA-binding NarL/FixJ family response regulator
MLRLIMFDDSVEYQDSVKTFLKNSKEVYLAAQYPHADDAVAIVKKMEPHIVLMDVQMPRHKSGINAMVDILKVYPETKVIILTFYPDDDKIFAAMQLGAKGFAAKDEIENLEKVIMDVHNGGGHYTAAVSARIASFFRDLEKGKITNYVELTAREKEVLSLMAKGQSRKMIADALYVGLDAVNFHIKNIFKKLEVNSATEAIYQGLIRKLIEWEKIK